jgi:hypothetical protein
MAIYRQSSREDRYSSTSGTVGQNGLVRIDNGVSFVVFQSEVHNPNGRTIMRMIWGFRHAHKQSHPTKSSSSRHRLHRNRRTLFVL